MKNRKEIIKRIKIILSFLFLFLLPSSLSKSLKETQTLFPLCPRAFIAFWRCSLMFKIKSEAFWGEETLLGAK
jgi:hypothetical protein